MTGISRFFEHVCPVTPPFMLALKRALLGDRNFTEQDAILGRKD